MREIKFRVWDKRTKKMRQLVNIVFNVGMHVEPNDNTVKLIWVKGYDCIEQKDIMMKREDKFELMQYTGLKDKNGKEIYEGDIFTLGDERILYIVEWTDTASFMGRQNGNKSTVGLKYWNDRIEVIGNIYDNPELLGGE